MKKLTDERLYEIKAVANAQGKESYEVMTNEELAAYKINCLDALEYRKKSMAKHEGKNATMYKIVSEGAEWLETALAYIDEKLSPKEEVDALDQFLNNWKEAARTYYTKLAEELADIKSDDQKINEETLRAIKWPYGKNKGRQRYTEKRIQEIVSGENITSFQIRDFKMEISSQRYKDWAEQLTQKDVNFVEMMRRVDNYLEGSLDSMVLEKRMMFLSRVTKKAGNILDMSGLTLGEDGSINGTVIGDKKTVEVTTVFAGGYNVQCLHFRVLVK